MSNREEFRESTDLIVRKDRPYLTRWAAELGVAELLQRLFERADMTT